MSTQALQMPPAGPQEQQAAPLLLELPEPLLLAVLQYLATANDYCSLFNAARAHSRLHQAAVAALSSISVGGIRQQQVLDGVVTYLGKNGQHVSSINLSAQCHRDALCLSQLPSTLQLHSLELLDIEVQLPPGNGWQGLLGPSALTKLQLKDCTLPEDGKQLETALAQLPALQHLSICDNWSGVPFPMVVLQGLQQLTHLDLVGLRWQGDYQANRALQPLQALGRLVDLWLAWHDDGRHYPALSASMLSGAAGLTRLRLKCVKLEPGALASNTELQHLAFVLCNVPATVLLAQLEPLQQLTYLDVTYYDADPTPAAAYSALTASSKLQHLGLTDCTLPAGVWQHVFAAGRQLPHLTSLAAVGVADPEDFYLAAPDGSRLVSCCPGLRHLDVNFLVCDADTLSPLQALSGLHTLRCFLRETGEALKQLCQLTQLQDLDLTAREVADGLLLQTTQLRQLTRLAYDWQHNGGVKKLSFVAQAPGDEPVWRQVLLLHRDHQDPTVAQAAFTALAPDWL